MTGPQLKQWRISAGLSGREVADDILRGQVTQPTVSRWEASTDPIPDWASDAILATTRITFTLAELHDLLDYCRINKQSFHQILAAAVRDFLSRQHSQPPNIVPLPAPEHPSAADQAIAELATPYPAAASNTKSTVG